MLLFPPNVLWLWLSFLSPRRSVCFWDIQSLSGIRWKPEVSSQRDCGRHIVICFCSGNSISTDFLFRWSCCPCAILFLSGSYILLFKIRNPEIRGPLTGMLCGCAGILVASYANMVYFQFPNGILIYSCFTFVFLGPYLDKQYSEIHGLPAA